MTRIATAAEQAQCTALGVELLTRVNSFIDALRDPGPVDDDTRSQEVGRLLLLAICAAGNDVEWLNRVFLVQGLGAGLGAVLAQWPHAAPALICRLEDGIAAGRQDASETFKARGHA